MNYQRLKDLLDQQHAWPCDYTFKFIVAKPELDAVLRLLPEATPVLRPSSRSQYVGVTFRVKMATSQDVVTVYERASGIESVISL